MQALEAPMAKASNGRFKARNGIDNCPSRSWVWSFRNLRYISSDKPQVIGIYNNLERDEIDSAGTATLLPAAGAGGRPATEAMIDVGTAATSRPLLSEHLGRKRLLVGS